MAGSAPAADGTEDGTKGPILAMVVNLNCALNEIYGHPEMPWVCL